MSDENKKNEEETRQDKQEMKIEDLPVDESKQDEVKGGTTYTFDTRLY